MAILINVRLSRIPPVKAKRNVRFASFFDVLFSRNTSVSSVLFFRYHVNERSYYWSDTYE